MSPRVPPSTSLESVAKEVKHMQSTLFVGIDVSLKTNAVCILDSQGKKLDKFSVPNDREGAATLASRACSHLSKAAEKPIFHFGIEATSVYGTPLLYFLTLKP